MDLLWIMIRFVFFFKQKTAYEMRISDWSSDVCSSDLSTTGLTSDETSLSLVCDENFGSGTLTESTQVRPSRASSPDRLTFFFLAMPEACAELLICLVRAARKPARRVPPPFCGQLLGQPSNGSGVEAGPSLATRREMQSRSTAILGVGSRQREGGA